MSTRILFSPTNHCALSTEMMRRSFKALAFVAVALSPATAFADTFTYNGATGGTWSTATNWTDSTTPATDTYPSTTTDVANLNNTASNRTVIYDSGSTGSLGQLNFTESSNAVNELDVQRNLQVGTASTATVVLGATGSGTAELLVDSYAPNLLTPTANSIVAFSVGGGSLTTDGTLTINSGGVLEMQGGTATGSGAGDVTVNANVALSGGTFNVDAASLAGTVVSTVNGNFIMTSGALNLDATPSGAYSGTLAGRQILQVNGNFQVTGGTVNDVNFPATSAITLNGTTSAGNTNYYYLTNEAPVISALTLTSNATTQQNFYSNQQLGAVTLTAANATSSKSLGAATSTGLAYSTGTLFVGSLKFSNTTASSTTTIQLASNVTQDNGGDQPVNSGTSTANATTFVIDTNGHTLDLTSDTTSTGGNNDNLAGVFSPGSTSIAGSGANSNITTYTLGDTSTGGTIKALGFDLRNGTTTNVTGDLILNATGTATLANNLSGAGTGTISPTSTFLYTGGTTGTLTSSRAIGRLAVGNGSASTLSLATANLTVGGDVTVNTSGILNLAGFNLTETPGTGATSGGLSGGGIVSDTSATSATLTLNIADGSGNFSGVIENKSTGSTTGTLALTLLNTASTTPGTNDVQILSGANTYTGGTTITSGTLLAESHTALGAGAVSVAAGAGLDYQATSDTQLALTSTLSITGGTGTTIGGSIGASTTTSKIAVTGAATTSGAVKVNVYGESGSTSTSGTGTYTLLSATSGLTGATYSLGFVYNNTNFTLTTPASPFTSSATALNVGITSQTALTSEYWNGGLTGATTVWAASNGNNASNWVTSASGGATALIPGSTATVTIAATSPNTSPASTTLGANMSILGLNISSSTGLGLNADGNTLTIGTGGIQDTASAPSFIAANVALGGNQTWSNASTSLSNALTVSGVISGTGNLTIGGAGTTILSGNSTYTGTTTISTTGTGKLQLSSLNAAQNSVITIGANNDLTFSGTTLYNIGGLSGTANEALVDTSSNGITLAVGNGNSTATYGGVLSGAGGLTKVGTGTQTLTNTNTYTGLLSLNGGFLDANTAGIDGSNTAYGIAFNGGTLQATSGGINTAKTITLVGTGTVDTTSGNVVFSGNINGAGTLTKAGTGTLTISGVASTYTTLQINDGTVLDGTSSISALGTTAGLVNFAATGSPILDLDGNSPTIGLLQGLGTSGATNGVITNSGSTLSTLTVGGGSSRNFGGVIQDGTGGIALVVIQTQASTGLTLFGTNTYSRGTTISGSSTVNLGASGTLGTGSVTLTSNGTSSATPTILNLATAQDTTIGSLSGTLGANAGDTATINTASGHNLVINQTAAGTYAGTIAGSGGVQLSSSSTKALTLSNVNTYSGGTSVAGGALYVNGGVSGTSSGTGSGTVNVTNSGSVLGGKGAISGAVTLGAGTTLYSGGVASGTPTVGAGTGMTLGTSLAVGSANLTFALGADTTSGVATNPPGSPYNFAAPSTNSTYLSLAGSTSINFTGTDAITLVDLTNGALALTANTPYLLIAANSNSQYNGLITVTGTGANAVYSIDGTGYVVGVLTSTSTYGGGTTAPLSTDYNPITINELSSNGVTPLTGPESYTDPVLYLNSGDLEVVPEPGTWALMLGGLALLIVIQRRRNKAV